MNTPTLGRRADDLDLELQASDLDPWVVEAGGDPAELALLVVD